MKSGAVGRNIKVSPQKMRVVVNSLRGLSVVQALDLLKFSHDKASFELCKILKSAVANAEVNASLDVDELSIVKLFVDQSFKLKRVMPRAKGRADRIEKRFCHVTVELGER